MENQITLLKKIIDKLCCLIKSQSESTPQIDVEKSGWVCKDDTWQNLYTTFTDGVNTGEKWIDSTISCEEAPPTVDFEIIQKERCDITTGTTWKQPVVFVTTDPTDATTVTEVAVAPEYDTGVSCETLKEKINVIDCDGNPNSVIAVPVVNQGTTNVKDCNSDKQLSETIATNVMLKNILVVTELDWRPACLDISGESIRGYAQFNKVTGDDTGLTKREDDGTVGQWAT